MLSILIPHIPDRQHQLLHLLENIIEQSGLLSFKTFDKADFFLNNLQYMHFTHADSPVEIWVATDDKRMPIGRKRDYLYRMAMYTYSWQIDDDDSIASDAIPLILDACAQHADCITFEEQCIIDTVPRRSNFSLRYDEWADNQDGYDHVRTPFFKTPILTSICQQVPVPAMRFGEDHEWSQLIRPLLQTEVHIDKPLYYYQHQSSPFTERYGFDKETNGER